jgi:hypothetical protein
LVLIETWGPNSFPGHLHESVETLKSMEFNGPKNTTTWFRNLWELIYGYYNRYQSQAALVQHFAAPEYKQFQATLKAENIIDFADHVDAEIRTIKQLAGFM